VSHAEVQRLNDQVAGIIQIESAGALRDAEAIAGIDGVDVLFVGPADLTHSLGIPGQFEAPAYREALASVAAACRAHGKAAGILVYDVAVVPDLLELGFTFVGIGADAAFVASGARAALGAVRGTRA
jgi:2-dehydro-3-deoxyglucarate aldolase/4-hydroxy-2-oxoheptanedioate aldolase